MSANRNPNRRELLMTGMAGAAAGMFSSREAYSQEKIAGIYSEGPNYMSGDEIRTDGRPIIVALMGQHCHNPLFMEINLRATVSKMDWRVIFTQYNEMLTPAVIDKADVLITLAGNTSFNRYSVGYVREGLVEHRPPAGRFMTEEQENAIFDGLENRGMGYLVLHNSLWNPRPRMREMLGHEWGFHPPIQPVLYTEMNQNHPITRGIEPWFASDEQFFARVNNPGHTILFNSYGTRDTRKTTSAWCFEHGSGRVVAMFPGHTEFVWRHPAWQELLLRSLMWLRKQPIPDNTRELVDATSPVTKRPGGFDD